MAKRALLAFNVDKWDSSFFKTRIARLKIVRARPLKNLSKMILDLLSLAKKRKVNFLVIKINSRWSLYEKILLGLGFSKYGESVDMVLKDLNLKATGVNRQKINLRLFKPLYRLAIRKIAKDAFRLSYLYRCGFAKKSRVDEYHSQWAENLSRDKNSKVFVAKQDRRIAGFIALNLDKKKRYARIVLIAVDKKHRGLGIGSMLVRGCIDWLRFKVRKIYVMTQTNNIRAISLYKKMSFKVMDHEKIFSVKL